MEDKFKKLEVLINQLSSISGALNLDFPDDQHMLFLREMIPEKVILFKQLFIEMTGQNPWD